MADATWTSVPARKKKTNQGPKHQQPSTDANPIDRSATPHTLLKECKAQATLWQKSAARKQIHQNLTTFLPTERISKGIILGSGSFCRDNMTRRRTSLLQLAAFVEMAVKVSEGQGMQLYAQEPEYTELDVEVLGQLGVEVLADPGAQGMFGRDVFVFAPFLELGLGIDSEAFLRGVGLYVGNALGEAGELVRARVGEEIGEMGRRADGRLRGYVKKDFPYLDEEPAVFNGLKLYFRHDEEEEGED